MTEIFTKESRTDFRLSKLDVQKGELEAVITSFKNYDVVNDRIMPGALDNFIKGFGSRSYHTSADESHSVCTFADFWKYLAFSDHEISFNLNVCPVTNRIVL